MSIDGKATQTLAGILAENKKLKEEISMMQRYKENEADKDTQVTPADVAKSADGTSLNSDTASQDDLNKKYEENEEVKDTQATVAQPVAKADGTPLEAGEASQDDMAKKYDPNRMEQNGEDEKAMKEQEGEDDPNNKKEQNGEEDKDKNL